MENFRDAELKKWLAEEYEKETEEMERILFPDGVIPDDGETEEEAKAAYQLSLIHIFTEAENKQNMEASGWIWCSIGASSGNYGRNGRRIYSKNKQRNFSSGNSCSNDTGDAELYSDKKSLWKKEKTGYAGA